MRMLTLSDLGSDVRGENERWPAETGHLQEKTSIADVVAWERPLSLILKESSAYR